MGDKKAVPISVYIFNTEHSRMMMMIQFKPGSRFTDPTIIFINWDSFMFMKLIAKIMLHSKESKNGWESDAQKNLFILLILIYV